MQFTAKLSVNGRAVLPHQSVGAAVGDTLAFAGNVADLNVTLMHRPDGSEAAFDGLSLAIDRPGRYHARVGCAAAASYLQDIVIVAVSANAKTFLDAQCARRRARGDSPDDVLSAMASDSRALDQFVPALIARADAKDGGLAEILGKCSEGFGVGRTLD